FAWVALAGLLSAADAEAPGAWSQFRGSGGRALAIGGQPLPTEIAPDQYVAWKAPLPPGHSSPVVHANHIYVTATKDKKLFTICLDSDSGRERWRAEVPYLNTEKIHAIGCFAQSTPATDGTHVVVLFGSAGLFCYDRAGKELWRVPMGPFKTE